MSLRHLTAIVRNKMSAPAQFLSKRGLLIGRVLDYGCGKGKDMEELSCEGYDPYYKPEEPKGTFDTIMCNFVLNVIENEGERKNVIEKILDLLNLGGVAYISVRNDKNKLKGYTSRGTYQTFVDLPFPIKKQTSSYRMYEVRK